MANHQLYAMRDTRYAIRHKERINILGIDWGEHDSAACLLQDGRLVAAAEEERFNRIKHVVLWELP